MIVEERWAPSLTDCEWCEEVFYTDAGGITTK